MTERERLIELLMQGAFNCSRSKCRAVFIADYLLANGVRVPLAKAEEAENAVKECENNA